MRQFIRHPVDVPVEIGIGEAQAALAFHTHDISQGGLAVHSDLAVDPGVQVEIRIRYVQPAFEARARVAWCRPGDTEGYELGVTFLDADDAFRARMVEQICHIEDYRKSALRQEGREVSLEDAAAEWIAKYAAEFPQIGTGQVH
ncbi:PilZ domain-containing protein [Aquabacterium sp.]|uniref:PilZ domain-containing protein n=1 Tax=Aquabacterium sp. TaxID=1872578 RepID=UPI002D12DBF6|nr:PilZ domain-containing protein [Aquabacterium sp.]HSW08958.1 PilZ domain-containing protein [Aquabacterium sp.]